MAVDAQTAHVPGPDPAAPAPRRSILFDPELHFRKGLDVEDRVEQVGRAFVFTQGSRSAEDDEGSEIRVVFFLCPGLARPPSLYGAAGTYATVARAPKKSRSVNTNARRDVRS